jgi:hypothetical protein
VDGAADELVLRVDTRGGFVPADVALGTLPTFSLYADGTLLLPGPQIEIYPPPALPPLVQRTIDEEGADAILDRAAAAGLQGPDRSFDTMLVTDAPTTTFTVVRDGAVHVTTVYALGESTGSELPTDERRARELLRAFQEDLFDLARWLPEGSLGPEAPYRPEAVRLYVGPYRAEPDLPQEPVRWPLAVPIDRLADTPVPGGRGCGVIAGSDLDLLMPSLERANTLTPWVDAGKRYSLVPRPLLPDERGC